MGESSDYRATENRVHMRYCFVQSSSDMVGSRQEAKRVRQEQNKRLTGRIAGAAFALGLIALRRKSWNFDSVKYVEKAVRFSLYYFRTTAWLPLF